LPAVDELEARPGHQVLHRLRHEDLARARLCHHARPETHRDATDFPCDDLALADVDPDAHVDADLPNAITDRHRAIDRPRGRAEGCVKAVAGRVDLDASVPLE